MQNIDINSYKTVKLSLINDEYMDFQLYGGKVKDYYIEDYNVTSFDINSCLLGSNLLSSNEIWADAINKDVELENIGFTGVDNGLLTYDKRRITNKEFLELYTGTSYNLPNKKMLMHPVSGNTGLYQYDIDKKDDYFIFKGGFYQGFYKTFGYCYQVLPDFNKNSWGCSFKLRRRNDYKETKALNLSHENNKGIFFYIGTRAENKFWKYYNVKEKQLNSFKKTGYAEESVFDFNEHVVNDDLFIIEEDIKNHSVNEEYWEKDVKITSNEFKTKDKIDSDAQGYYEIKTDNKFITFNRTKSGFTVDNYDENVQVILTDIKKKNINLYPLMNRTETGYTVDNIEEFYDENKVEYNVLKDLDRNCFALRLTDNGSIGYRYGRYDCNEELFYVDEEYSKEGLINDNEWCDVLVKFKYGMANDMKIYFYINNKLMFISKTLPLFNFKELNETYQKQEGVGYNISLGGGTQGLCETIYPDYYMYPEYILPIEKNFAGTFIGDIKYFNIYRF